MRQTWKRLQWPLVVLLAVGAGILGFQGFSGFFASIGEPRSPWDTFYLTLQLFVLESGSVWGPVPWELQVARLLAPATAGYAAVGALAILFREQSDRFRIRFFRGHIVICGLGRKGLLLAKSLRRRGDRVLIIEADAENDRIEPARDHGALVLIADARDPKVLRRAGVERAGHVVAVKGVDGWNAEVAVRVRELLAGGKGASLTCLVHIVDPDLCALLRMQEISKRRDERFRLDFFNVFESGARALLRAFPITGGDRAATAREGHIVVVGVGHFGENLILQAAREWRSEKGRSGSPLQVTVVDRQATPRTGSMMARYPWLQQVCRVTAVDALFEAKEFTEARFLFDAGGHLTVSAVFICLDDDALGLSAGLTLYRHVKNRGVPVVIRTVQGEGLASLLRQDPVAGGEFGGVHAFGLLDRMCDPDLLFEGVYESLARAMHEEYVRGQEKKGETSATNPAMVRWTELQEGYKESNRAQAAHVGVKLAAAGCDLVPFVTWDAEGFTFDPEEVERLAEMEHDRWMQERIRAGWSDGPRNPEKKTSPHLVSWGQLDENIRELDRIFVRKLPLFLARAGFQIARVGSGIPGSTERPTT